MSSAPPDAARRVLLVEDETLVAMLLEDMLDELGFEVVETASRLEAGLAAADNAAIDLAVLDINLGGNSRSFPIADRLRQRGIPFLFATGHIGEQLDALYLGVPVLQKPFRAEDLMAAIRRAVVA